MKNIGGVRIGKTTKLIIIIVYFFQLPVTNQFLLGPFNHRYFPQKITRHIIARMDCFESIAAADNSSVISIAYALLLSPFSAEFKTSYHFFQIFFLSFSPCHRHRFRRPPLRVNETMKSIRFVGVSIPARADAYFASDVSRTLRTGRFHFLLEIRQEQIMKICRAHKRGGGGGTLSPTPDGRPGAARFPRFLAVSFAGIAVKFLYSRNAK